MTQEGVQLDRESFSCSICLDLLKDPVTIPCGHSYCMKCIEDYWDEEDHKKIHICPQCRKTFTLRPVLVKSTMLAALIDQLKTSGLQAVPADHSYAGPEDVACDVCTGRKLKAIKSCLVCLVSYCEKHLQPHYDVAQMKKHQLLEPSKKLHHNICSRHDEVMKMFCRTDQQSICYVCTVDGHKDHHIVSAAAERSQKQEELQVRRGNIQQRIQGRETDVKLLQQQLEDINTSADKTVEDSEKIFTQLIRLLQERSSEVKQQIRSQQETEARGVRELQEKLEQELTELKRKDAELKQLSDTEDHNQFLHDYPSVSELSESPHSSSINAAPLRYFEDVTAAVEQLRDKLQDILRDMGTNVSLKGTEGLLPEPEQQPRSRATLHNPPPAVKFFSHRVSRPSLASLLAEQEPEPRSRAALQNHPFADKLSSHRISSPHLLTKRGTEGLEPEPRSRATLHNPPPAVKLSSHRVSRPSLASLLAEQEPRSRSLRSSFHPAAAGQRSSHRAPRTRNNS